MSWPLILAIVAVMVLLGAIVAIGARPRAEDAGITPRRARREGDSAGYTNDGGGSGDSCSGDAGADCGGGDGGGGGD